jgi:hypothetical protein
LAFEKSSANGRYLVAHEPHFLIDFAAVIKKNWPDLPAPTYLLPDIAVYMAAIFDKRLTWTYLRVSLGKMPRVSHEKAEKELGLQFRPFETTIIDATQSMLDRNMIKYVLKFELFLTSSVDPRNLTVDL